MTLRKVPGAAALGLLASLAAHGLLYGHEHAMGGVYHALLAQVALAGAITMLALFWTLAWNGSRDVAEGSVLAARLRDRLPGLGSVLAPAALWYAIAESIEPRHASIPSASALLALGLAAWLVLRCAQWLAGVLSDVVIAFVCVPFSPRTRSWRWRLRQRPVLRLPVFWRRRFARPPPIAILRCA